MFAHTSINCTETTMLLTLKWRLASSITRPSLNHVLATEKSTFSVKERLFFFLFFFKQKQKFFEGETKVPAAVRGAPNREPEKRL